MRDVICGLGLLLLGAPALGQPQGVPPAGPDPRAGGGGAAPECARRYQDFFVRVPVVAVRATDQTRANAEVKALFGPRPEVCEPGGYARFLEGFNGYAREAVRAKPKLRDNMVRAAMAVLEVGPLRLPPEDQKAAQSLFRQAKSDLAATIADVRSPTPLLDYFLSAFERSGVPEAAPAQAAGAPGGPAGGSVQSVRIPTSALPPWVVVSLYEALDLQRQKSYEAAQGKLEVVLRWMETAP